MDDRRKLDDDGAGPLATGAQDASYDGRSAEYGAGRNGNGASRTTPREVKDHTVIYKIIAKLPFRLLMLLYMIYLLMVCWNPPADINFFVYMGQCLWTTFIIFLTFFDLPTGMISTFLKRCVLAIVERLENLVNAVRGS